MKFRIDIDFGSIALGVGIGLLIAPYVYDKKKLKKTATKGAVKEVSRSIFSKKED